MINMGRPSAAIGPLIADPFAAGAAGVVKAEDGAAVMVKAERGERLDGEIAGGAAP
jgi:hypothetical protein